MIIVPDVGLLELVPDLVRSITAVVHLYVEPVLWSASTTLADLSELTGGGYSPQRERTWSPAEIRGKMAVTTGDPLRWQRAGSGGPFLVYGYYVTDGESGPLLWGEERQAGAIPWERDGDTVIVVPRFALGRCGTPTLLSTGDLVSDGVSSGFGQLGLLYGDLVQEGHATVPTHGVSGGDLVLDGGATVVGEGGDLVFDGSGSFEEGEELPIGSVTAWAGSSAPTNWMKCDGSALSIASYPALNAALGGTWDTFRGQSAPGAGMFRIPWLDGFTIVGAGPADPTWPTSTRSLGTAIGEETHVLITAELAIHAHGLDTLNLDTSSSAGGMPYDGAPPDKNRILAGAAYDDNPAVNTSSMGSDTAHNNMQPSGCLYWIIRVL